MLICDRLGLKKRTVSNWMKVYGSADYSDKRLPRRPQTERNRVAREVISGKLSMEEAQLKYGITCRDTLTLWIRQYRKTLPDVSQTALEVSPPESSTAPALSAVQDIGLAELRIRALETMLDIASKEFNVNIRKKFGAKQ
jgi:transposase-like protein